MDTELSTFDRKRKYLYGLSWRGSPHGSNSHMVKFNQTMAQLFVVPKIKSRAKKRN